MLLLLLLKYCHKRVPVSYTGTVVSVVDGALLLFLSRNTNLEKHNED